MMFPPESISHTVEQAELNEAFHRLANECFAKFMADGKAVAWDDAKRYLEARARGDRVRKPAARKVNWK